MSIITEPPFTALSLLASLSLCDYDDPPCTSSIIHTLPPDALDRIVRHLSTTPRSAHWTCNVPSLTVHALFKSCPTFAARAGVHFGQITTTSGPWPTHAPPATCGALLSVSTTSESDLLAALLRAAGTAITALHLTHAPRYSAWALSAAAHCTHLTSLSVAVGPELDAALDTLLSVRGARLRTLAISGSTLSRNLEGCLRLHCPRLENLTLHLRAFHQTSLTTLLRGLGPGLQHLTLHASETPLCAGTLTAVATSCVALTELSLASRVLPPLAAQALVTLAVRLRARLRRFSLTGAPVPACVLTSIATLCPNCTFAVDAARADASTTLTATCARAHALRLIAVPQVGSSAWECARLERLEITKPAADVAVLLKALSARRGLPALREASVRVFATGDAGTEEARGALKVLARAGGLRKLFFAAPWLPVAAFDAVARDNFALVDASVSFSGLSASQRRARDRSGRTAEVLESVVRSFGGCKEIGNLVVRDVSSASRTRFEQVTRACVPLRYRDITVLVCGVQYLR